LRTEKTFKLAVQYATDHAGTPTRPQFRRWVKAALMQPAEIVLRLVDETEGRELNRQFRGKDYATNVLTFVYDDMQPLTGDIVLCAPVVGAEAQQQHKGLLAHYAHLTVHGVLHLQGYDHIEDAEAAQMEQLETQILAKLGYPDPYAGCL
jgi:probable rRNA maturation factor